MHRRVYQSLKDAPRLINKKAYLQSVNVDSLSVNGGTEIDFTMVGTKFKHVFFIVSDMNRNMILNLTCWEKWHKVNFRYRDLKNL